MSYCMNEECDKNPLDSLDKVFWGCDGDSCCNQECYDKARKQMDHFCTYTLSDDVAFASWLGVPESYL